MGKGGGGAVGAPEHSVSFGGAKSRRGHIEILGEGALGFRRGAPTF